MSVAQFINVHKVELTSGSARMVQLGKTYSNDNLANRLGAYVFQDGQPVDLDGQCAGAAILADGSTVGLTNGVVSGNLAYVTLTSDCYQVEGPILVFVKWVSNTISTTLISFFGTVTITETDRIANAGDGESVYTLLGQIERKADAVTATASGTIASFSDGGDGLPVKSCAVTISPVQSGSGTPSGSNIRPISGWTKAHVYRTGVNVWDEQWEAGVWTAAGEKANSGTGYYQIRCKNEIPVTPGTTYYVKSANTLIVRQMDASKAVLSTANSVKDQTITTEANTRYLVFCTKNTDVVTTYGNDIAINYTATKTAYIAHAGNAAYEISLGRTVYGGELNVTLGTLKVTHANIASYAGETLPGEWISDRDVYAAGTTPTTGAQVVYQLATPIEYVLTGQEIRTLLGDNNVFADAGAVAVEYRADTKLYMTAGSSGNAIPAPASPTTGQYLQWNGSAWVAASLPIFNGGVE